MTLETIRQHLAGEPYCFLPDQMDVLDRDTIFALYIRPAKKKKSKRPPPSTYREQFFASWMSPVNGKTWVETEALWQQHLQSSRSPS